MARMELAGPHIIVGLGNPGPEYEDTRHNAGFKVIDALASQLGANYWKLAAQALVAQASYKGSEIILIKPQTFMNLSGGAVKGLSKKYNYAAQDLLVIHDELDLPAGTIRLKIGGGHAGHNGLRSLHQSIGSDYARLRIGVGRPQGRMPAQSFVLQRIKSDELKDFEVTVAEAAAMVLKTVEEGVLKTMNDCNRSVDADSTDKDRIANKGRLNIKLGVDSNDVGKDNANKNAVE